VIAMENAGHFDGLNPRSAGQSVINSVKSFGKIEKAESQTVDTLAIRKLHILVCAHDPQHDPHWERKSPPRGITHDIGCRKLVSLPASLEFAPTRREHVLHPLGLTAVGKSDDEAVRRSKDIYGRPVDLPRFPTHMRENAEARQPASEQARDPVGEGNVDLRQPSLAEAHHEDA
jgi:hypothetical protein